MLEVVDSMNKVELYRLLDEMTSPDGIIGLLDTPNWRFWKKTERLDEQKLFLILREFIETRTKKEDAHLRENACLLLGKLLLRVMEPEVCQFLVDRLSKETDKYVLHSILGCISRLKIPPEVNIDAIITCSKSEQSLVRHQAIHALVACDTDASREAVRYWVRQTDEKKYKYELIYANAALGYMGDQSDIGLLEQHIHSRIRDVKDSAVYAIENIRKRACPGIK